MRSQFLLPWDSGSILLSQQGSEELDDSSADKTNRVLLSLSDSVLKPSRSWLSYFADLKEDPPELIILCVVLTRTVSRWIQKDGLSVQNC